MSLGVLVKSHPGPHVPRIVNDAGRPVNVLGLRVAERPNLVGMDATGWHVADLLVVVRYTRSARVDRSLETVLIETPMPRLVECIEEPSTRHLEDLGTLVETMVESTELKIPVDSDCTQRSVA